MTRSELFELASLQALCLGGALALLSTLTGLALHFGTLEVGGAATGCGLVAVALTALHQE
ncbi:hypothetical protein [Endothiovibrio diazotrophicus]